MPTLTRELKSRERPKGLPVLGQIVAYGEEDEMSSSRTPFRLPRLDGDKSIKPEDPNRAWGRHGYEYYNNKPIDVCQVSTHLNMSPRHINQELRRSNMNFPKFSSAVLVPTKSFQSPRLLAQDFSDPAFYKSFIYRGKTGIEHFPELDPSPSPELRDHSRSISPTKSIHWALSSYRNYNSESKGQSRVQGPYSREFTVTCSAPNNWLRMKLGRSKTTLT